MAPNNDSVDPKLRIGAVSYLNTKPLIDSLDVFLPGADLSLDLPSRLADQLARGDLDIALIPSIEFFQDPSYTICSSACIACPGEVWSVRVLFRKPPHLVRSLALDEGSRTSCALAQVLLWKRFGIRPELHPWSIDADIRSTTADAVLIIGDRAMRPDLGPWLADWDLGQEWNRLTGLPFVFAMWVARAGIALGGVDLALDMARNLGMQRVSQIAEIQAPLYGLTTDQCQRYFCENLYYTLGPRERRGLSLFYESASALGLAPAGRDPAEFLVTA